MGELSVTTNPRPVPYIEEAQITFVLFCVPKICSPKKHMVLFTNAKASKYVSK
jgi:hypothetical protein